jgi:hypothetical protein
MFPIRPYCLLPFLTRPFHQTVTTILKTHVEIFEQQSKRVESFYKKSLLEILVTRMMLSWATRLSTRKAIQR